MIELETIPKGWTVAKFNECCENISLNGIKIKQKQYLASGKFPVIDQGRELIGGYFNDELLAVPNEPPYIVFGDHTKVKKYVTFKFIAGADGVKVLKPFDFILPKLFFYFIHAVKMPDKGYARHYQFLASEKFPIPPFNEQKRILAKLEQLLTDLDKGIEYLETTKQQLKVYRQAVLKWAFEGKLTKFWRSQQGKIKSQKDLIQMIDIARKNFQSSQIAEWEESIRNWESNGSVGKKPSKPSKIVIPDLPNSDHEIRKWDTPKDWIWSQIGSICFVTKLAGFEYTDYVKYNDNGDLFVLKAENVGANGFKTTDFSKIYSNTVEMLKRSFLQGGELLIVFVGAGTGNVAMVPNDKSYFLGPNIGMARPYSKINSRFLEYQLQSSLGKGMLTATVKAVAQPSLSMGTIRQTPIVFTSIEEQNEVVKEIESRLSVCDKIEETIESSLQQAEALRLSIIKKAFEGKLVPQDPNDEPAEKLLERIRAAKGNGKSENKEKVAKSKKSSKLKHATI